MPDSWKQAIQISLISKEEKKCENVPLEDMTSHDQKRPRGVPRG